MKDEKEWFKLIDDLSKICGDQSIPEASRFLVGQAVIEIHSLRTVINVAMASVAETKALMSPYAIESLQPPVKKDAKVVLMSRAKTRRMFNLSFRTLDGLVSNRQLTEVMANNSRYYLRHELLELFEIQEDS